MTQANTKSNTKSQLDTILTIDTLIITVSTRQIGWRCDDGIVRCFGANGDYPSGTLRDYPSGTLRDYPSGTLRDYPSGTLRDRNKSQHTKELYENISVEGKFDPDISQPRKSRWCIRDLGKLYYDIATAKNDFSKVELLLDEEIIYSYADQGMKQIILWGTNQPESNIISDRQDDTLWLAELMAQKIELLKRKHDWELEVRIVKPIIDATKHEDIYQFLSCELQSLLVDRVNSYPQDQKFVLAIEDRGCVPTFSTALAILAAGLIRQNTVIKLEPILPESQYIKQDNGTTAIKSQKHNIKLVSDYFWSLEKGKIISAWRQGYFSEATIWLTPHQHRYDGLIYQLSQKLTLCNNDEFYSFIHCKDQGMQPWIDAVANSSLHNENPPLAFWRRAIRQAQRNNSALVYESSFLIELLLARECYSNAFRLFSQTIERLLYAECHHKDWIRKGIVKTEGYKNPSFYRLIEGWLNSKLLTHQKRQELRTVLHNIREIRNEIVHKAMPIKATEIVEIWIDSQLEDFQQLNYTDDKLAVHEGMRIIINWIYSQREKTLFKSLYEWGLEILERK